MAFVAISPARQLRAAYPVEKPKARHAGDWLKLADGAVTSCGLKVFDEADPRHIGRIESISGSRAKVRWLKGGWVSYLDCDCLSSTGEDFV